MRTKPGKAVKLLWTRAAGLLCGALLAVLAGSPPSLAQPDAAAPAPPAQAAPAVDPITALSGLDVVAKPKPKPTEVSGLDVVARSKVTAVDGLVVAAPRRCPSPQNPPDKAAPQPKLVSSYPANGQTVPPGYVVLRLTFDQPMACRGSLPQYLLSRCYSDGKGTWRQSTDKHSLLILCYLLPRARYVVSINRRIPEHFRALSGREPNVGGLSFQISQGAPVLTQTALVGRDPQLAALLSAAPPARQAAGAEPEEAGPADATEVSHVRIEAVKTCMQARFPPDPGVPAPKVISSFPAQGQAVRPGLLEIRFTFDLPMACTGEVGSARGENPCKEIPAPGAVILGPSGPGSSRPGSGDIVSPEEDFPIHRDGPEIGVEHWVQLWDRRTMRFQCQVEPGKSYLVLVNTLTSGTKFKGLGGKAAEPYRLAFTASKDAPVQTEEEADDEDPLIASLIEGHEAGREQ